jgi:hypothetical protein
MGMTIRAGKADLDGLVGVEIRVWNDRYTGSAFLWATDTQLSEFAAHIRGFPARAGDQRTFHFGARDPGVLRGYCGLHFRTRDSAGHAVVDVIVEDGPYSVGDFCWKTSPAKAEFSIPVEAADIDRFVDALHAVAEGRADEAGW